MQCANCGVDLVEGARFCASCGTPVAQTCSTCGAALAPEARFCSSCGSPVEAAEPAEERKLVTILFADVTGSTTLGERLDPEQLRDVLDTYFSAMRAEIEAEGGTVEKFIGDAVMAAFGVPQAHEDDAARALQAAVRMRDRLGAVNEQLRSRHDVELEMAIGVHTGDVLANVDPEPGEPMVTGDAVNTAARLQSAAGPGRIVVGERTVRSCPGFRFESIGDLDLKGKAGPVPAYLLAGFTGEPARGITGLSAPLIGRERELDLLDTTYERVVAEARPHLVTIYGDPGIGKSRLTREFIDRLLTSNRPPLVLEGRCLPYGDGVTYWPLVEILRDYAGIRDADGPAEALAHVRERCGAVLARAGIAEPESVCGALAYTMGVDDPDRPLGDKEPRLVRSRIHGAWRALLTAIADEHPAVTLIEDIHWADDAMLDLLEEVAERAGGPVLFLCPSRPDLPDRRPGWGGGRRNASSIELDPLSNEESGRLVSELLAIDDLPEDTRALILRRAEGNPFFLEEIVRTLVDRGLVVRHGDRWRAGTGVSEVEIPDTVQALLAARIDLLDRAEKRTLQRAAVVGRTFWPAPVELLLNGDGDQLAASLDRLEARDLVRSLVGSSVEGQPEFVFKHVLTRDVAYETIPRRERSNAHAVVAEWIGSVSAGRRPEFAELLAYHYAEAYEGARDDPDADPAAVERLRVAAFRSTIDAARGARARYAVAKATALVERALASASTALERVTALELVGQVALDDYRGDRAYESFRAAADIRLAELPEDRAAVALACARAVESPQRWPGSMRNPVDDAEVARYIALGFENLDDERTEAGIRLLSVRSFGPFASIHGPVPSEDEIEDARAAGLRAADLAESLGRLDLVSGALDGASSAALSLGLYGEDEPVIRRRLKLTEQIDDPWELGDTFAMGAWSYTMLGDYARASEIAAEGFQRAEEQAPGVAIHARAWRALAHFLMGDWNECERALTTIRQRLGDRRDDPPYFVMPAYGAIAFVNDARARPADDLIAILEQHRGTAVGGSLAATYWYVWIQTRRGDIDRARGTLGDLGASNREIFRPFEDMVLADCLPRWNAWDEVPGFLIESRAAVARSGVRAVPVHLDRLEGRAAAHEGNLETAERKLAEAIEGFDGLGAPVDRAVTQLDLAEALGPTDEPSRRLLGDAVKELERVGWVDELTRARALNSRFA